MHESSKVRVLFVDVGKRFQQINLRDRCLQNDLRDINARIAYMVEQ